MENFIRIMVILFHCSLLTDNCIAQTLDIFFAEAAKNNPGLQAKYKAFEAALEKIPQAKSLTDPTLSFGYFMSPIETQVGPQQVRLSLTQQFPWFGTLRANGHLAALEAEAQYQAFLDERNKLFYRVAAAYYPLYEQEKWLDLERKNKKILESYKAIATSKFENAEGALADVLRVDLMLKDALTNVTILGAKKRALLHTFNTLLNRGGNTLVETPDTLVVPKATQAYRQATLFERNPLIKAFEIKIEASEVQEVLSVKKGLPKLGIGLDYMMVGQRQGLVSENNGKDALLPMVSFSLPLYRGKYKSAKKEAQLTQESYALEKENIIDHLSSAYEVTIFELFQQKKMVELYQEQISQTQQVLNLLLSAYSNSGKAFEEVLRIQQQLLQYQKMKATALVKYHIYLAKLDYLTSKKY